jgi:glucoamylase
MTKTYFNEAIIGNSRMLGCLSDSGELVRLFWPHIDYPQHIEKLLCGIFDIDRKHSTTWFTDEGWIWGQEYVQDTNILQTLYEHRERSLKVMQTDFCLNERDVLVRKYEFENTGEHPLDLGFMMYSSFVSSSSLEPRSTLFDFTGDSLVHYWPNYYFAISADREAFQFQLGSNVYDSTRETGLKGYDNIGMMPDGAVSWKLGSLSPGAKKGFALYICASSTLKGVKSLVRDVKGLSLEEHFKTTKDYWLNFLKDTREIITGMQEIDSLYKRSLLVFKLMADEKTGGLLAAPEIDENFTRCGRYAYCWGRDAAFITSALDQSGLSSTVDKFYDWAAKAQDDDGVWHQRYHMDGNLAPSWGLQIDETGTLIWGMLKHFESIGDKNFLHKMWKSVEMGVEFLINFIDNETGLPWPSFDLWEERYGEHTYSAAAVCGGIRSGAKIAKTLGKPLELIKKWNVAAEKLKDAIERNLWRVDRNCFLRSIRTKMNPWGDEYSPHTTMVRVNTKGYYRDVTLEDDMIDVSLLGLAIPFDVYDVNDIKIKYTVREIERKLSIPYVGGIKRYESDSYIGGNPWVLTTLWVALYYIRIKDFDKAKKYFEWSLKSRTELGLLPEQVSKEDGKPAWVIPLTWSHAMFVLVLRDLFEAGVL